VERILLRITAGVSLVPAGLHVRRFSQRPPALRANHQPIGSKMTELFRLGGPVLWLLCALAVAAAAVFFERALSLHRARVDATDFLQGIFNAMRRGNRDEAAELCDETPGPVARIALVAVRRSDSPRERLLADLESAGHDESARMRRRISALSLVARVAPLLGLLGTAVGILKGLLAYRAALPFADFTGVADSLLCGAVTTAVGLAVAIPAHVAHSVLSDKVDRLELDMREAASECVFFFDSLRKEDRRG